MRILILSCNTGGGHNSCAAAIGEVFEKNGYFCKTADAFSFISEGFSRFISNGHSLMYRYFPAVFRFGYSFFEKHSNLMHRGKLVYRILTSGAEKLYDYIVKNDFDTIICVHTLSGIILDKALFQKKKTNLKTAFVATDHTCSPGTNSFDYDYYFISDSSVANEFINAGIPAEKIFAFGIPVRENFIFSTEKSAAKKAVGISPENMHLLIMGGSMGCGPMEKVLYILSKKITSSVDITIICGKNRKLYNKLYSKYNSNKNIHIVGYSEEIPLLMDSADLCLTKPGGLSTTESLSKALPMVLIDAVSGCEKYNMEFYLKNGGGETADSEEVLAEKCLFLLENKDKLSAMSKKLKRSQKNFAAADIFICLGGKNAKADSRN